MPVLKALFRNWDVLLIFVWAKLNVRSKWLRVNSIFLVQLRKNSGEGSRRFSLIKKNLQQPLAMRVTARVSERAMHRGMNLVKWAAGLSTGLAQEMQKPFSVGGNMRRVAFGFLSLLVMTLSVPGQIAGAKTVALHCGNLFDARGDSLRKNVLVVIEGEKIKDIAATAPTGVEVIDLSHETCLPGLMDTHTHVLLGRSAR